MVDDASSQNIDALIPQDSPELHEFARFLADHLNDTLTPLGFYGCVLGAIDELRRGIDGFTDEPIRSPLVRQRPQMYLALLQEMPTIACAVCPSDFAQKAAVYFE